MVKRPAQPSVVDDDEGTIFVRKDGEELRAYNYDNDDERRIKMQRARDYVEGWVDSAEKIFSRIDTLMKRIESGEDTR